MKASAACHLHRPTFYVKNPYCQKTENSSHPTIQQISQAGFSSQNWFFYNHICRRDRIVRQMMFFYSTLRTSKSTRILCSLQEKKWQQKSKSAVKPVRERMKQLLNLVPIKFWESSMMWSFFWRLRAAVLFGVFYLSPCRHFFLYHRYYTILKVESSSEKLRQETGPLPDSC